MSTEDQNRAVVTLHKGVDTEEFVNQMLDNGYELHNEKPGSLRNFDFVMTQEQAATLREDARVIDVRYGSKVDNGIHLIKNVIQETQQYNKDVGATVGSDHGNWAHVACVNTSDPFTGQSITIPDNFKYTLDGTDVDVVIQDSGVQPDHPEFLADDLTTMRYKTVDWPTISGLSQYTQPTNFHRDIDGHGSHVASTVAGRRLGWAKNANIYSMKILDDPGNTFGASASFEMIRAWHNLKKTNNPNGDTYPVRPTVVNMSWGYFGKYENIQNGSYRGSNWNGTIMQDAYGMIQGQQDEGVYTHPLRVASVDADVQDCLDAGIIMVGAAGNGSHKIDTTTGLDYDNYYTSTVYGNRYYHRGSSPVAQGNVICVGNISYVYVSGQEPLFNSSEKGPRVDVCAPGGNITGAIPTGSTKFNNIATVPHLDNGGYVIGNLNGTSMASPQVAGVLAALLQVRPHYTQEQCLTWLQEVCQLNRLYDPTTGTPGVDYINFRALQGAANLFLQTPFVDSNPYIIST